MAKLSTETFDNVLKIIRVTNSCLDTDKLSRTVLDALHKTFRTNSCVFFPTNPDGQLIKAGPESDMFKSVSINIDQHYLAMYRTHFCGLNPYYPPNLGSLPKSVIRDKDLRHMPKFIGTEYYNDFLKPQNIHHQMAFYLRSGKKIFGIIGLHRPKKSEGFSKQESDIGEIISPHLVNAFEKAELFTRLKEKTDFFHTICNNTSLGFAVMDVKNQLIFFNKKAVETCARINSAGIPIDKVNFKRLSLPMEVYKDCVNLRSSWKKFPRNLSLFTKQRIFTLSEMEKYLIRCELLDEKLTGQHGLLCLITMGDISLSNMIDEGKLKKEYNLTKREIEIVIFVFKGYRNSEIAEFLFISEGTVKNHLKNIFSKMRVANRTSIIHEALYL